MMVALEKGDKTCIVKPHQVAGKLSEGWVRKQKKPAPAPQAPLEKKEKPKEG